MSTPAHQSVLLHEVVAAMAPRDGGIYVDGTFGAGGYTQAILQAADCAVIAIDRDPQALSFADALRARYGDRLMVREGCFGNMVALADACGIDGVDGVMLDLGVSSMQLDNAARGFSFMRDGPLDMRMGTQALTAEALVNEADPDLLANIIAVYGEERRAKAIARAIARRRTTCRLTRTRELTDVVCGILGQPNPRHAHPATRTFQALRIYLNDELGELLNGLQAAEQLLKTGGKLAVVTFHSLEDRMVKQFLTHRSGRAPRPSRHLPAPPPPAPLFARAHKKPITPQEAELARNPRARSARLRVAERTATPSYPIAEDLMPPRAPRATHFKEIQS